jgi:phenylpropionate dioxygenase-like ring-hydroxylating dioxygenase large terminal subunit
VAVTDQTAMPPAAAGEQVDEILASDVKAPPATLLQPSRMFYPATEVDVARYTSREWHELEVERLWSRVWQFACREEELPKVGDHVLYEIAGTNLIIVRTAPDRIRAYYNACLHRGTRLRDEAGCVNKFRCPFHGFTWGLDGTLSTVPSEWDFPDLDPGKWVLPEARAEVWAGFVFINLDSEAPSLVEYLEILPDELKPFDLGNRYKASHVSQVVPCNWKVAMEAFIEGFHVPYTHPESVPFYDSAIRYDVWPGVEHTSRLITLGAVASPNMRGKVSEQKILDAFQSHLPVEKRYRLGPAEVARPHVAALLRSEFGRKYKTDLSNVSDSEIVDQIQYFSFPNMVPWPGVGAPLIYRFRPYGDDPHRSLMEIIFLHPMPTDGSTPQVAEEFRLEPDAQWSTAPGLGGYGPIIDQDMPNLRRVQQGLKTTRKKTVRFSSYQESRIIHFHQTLTRYIADF